MRIIALHFPFACLIAAMTSSSLLENGFKSQHHWQPEAHGETGREASQKLLRALSVNLTLTVYQKPG